MARNRTGRPFGYSQSPVAVHLSVLTGSVDAHGTQVHLGPGPDYAMVGSLPGATSIVAVAVTIDNQWIQIAEPLAGWLEAGDVTIPDE